MTDEEFAKSLKWRDLLDLLDFYRDFPRYRLKEEARFQALLAENHSRVKSGNLEPS